MPKGKRKGKHDLKKVEQAYSSEEDGGDLDNYSETSGQSDLKSLQDEADGEAQEKLEQKVMDAIEGLSARSADARVVALRSLRAALQRRPLGAALSGHRAALAGHVARALRRGRLQERIAAAGLAPILALQIGEEGVEEFMQEVRPALAATAVDMTAGAAARAECCSSLAVLCYLFEEDVFEILEVIRMYETIFSGACAKESSCSGEDGDDAGAWRAAALDGWTLLASLPELPPPPPPTRAFQHLLEDDDIDVRLAAGGAVCAAVEREGGAGGAALAAAARPRLEHLASGAHKRHARRHRRQQRATFRDILKYIEDSSGEESSVQLGGGECVWWSRWSERAAYEALAAQLGAGLRALAPHAPALRRALRLPPAPPAPADHHAPAARHRDKLQRHLANNAACKARTVARNKNRDKRCATLSM